jgi:purine nucleosidase
MKKIGRPELPVLKGGRKAGETDSEASLYLAKMAEEYAGELEILVTGSVTNLYGAWKHNPKFFEQVKRIVLMGGTTQPLLFAKKEMKELNFSCDPLATYTVLTRGTDVAVITGNNCLKVLFTREEYEREFADESRDVVRFIKKETDYWFDNNMDVYGIPGYYNWDVIAAAYMMHPELFKVDKTDFILSVEALKKGRLTTSEGSEKNCTLEIPVIGEETRFRRNIYDTWLNVRFGETK